MLLPLSYCFFRSLASLLRSEPVIRAPFFNTPAAIRPALLRSAITTHRRDRNNLPSGIDSSRARAPARSTRAMRAVATDLDLDLGQTDLDHPREPAIA